MLLLLRSVQFDIDQTVMMEARSSKDAIQAGIVCEIALLWDAPGLPLASCSQEVQHKHT